MYRLGLLDLAEQVGQETDTRGGRVRHVVCRHDLDEVLLARGLARGGRAGARQMRRRGGLLRPGVHVAFVVEAEVDEVLVALGCGRQALEADVVGAAIAGEDDNLRVVLASRIECTAQARCRGGARLERRLIDGNLERAVRLRARDDRHARGWNDGHRLWSERGEHVPHRQRIDATRTRRVPRAENGVFRQFEFLHVNYLTQTECGCASLALAIRTKSAIFSGETLTPPTPAR